MKKTIAITGASGQIGYALVSANACFKRGYDSSSLDRPAKLSKCSRSFENGSRRLWL